MEKKNRDLVLKNVKLKEEINDLMLLHKEAVEQSLKTDHNYMKFKNSCLDLLNENISSLEDAISKTKKLIQKIERKRTNKEDKKVLSEVDLNKSMSLK
ncbi:hypothetical protein EDEG_05085 [Edhazardia aedis USNM 41457]|uniref:Uncharacterized protein n=1 Tax=Edhazardia aedis (strain USNM 41457) TaxID=1003232 RepID=A0A0L1P647_EDHAE|nr:hypothetical protein EDEG_05085 [Edhazardia aedis USNM 41457]|eukprot:KNH48533.1 hypothetical protein EDEG_05085 [Edhazardia aedis USNM 41457]